MKKILIVVCAVLLFLVVGTMYSEGLFDTRFWFYDHNVYDEFHRGSHVGGKDLEPGTYVVEIQGGSKDTGHISISKPKVNGKSEEIYGFWIKEGEDSFQFTIDEGEILDIKCNVGRKMKIKKID